MRRRPAWLLALPLCARAATAAEPVTPPAMYPPQTWEGRSAAIVRVLDKLDAHVETLTIPVGGSGSYKSLGIAVRSCLQHPPGLPPDAAAALGVRDGEAAAAFEGWMFSAEPFVAVFESPVYGVQLVSCGGGEAAPAAPPLPTPVLPPALPPAATPTETAPPPTPRNETPPDAEPSPVYPSGAPPPDAPPPDAPPPDAAPPD